jgi:hypothetical protein
LETVIHEKKSGVDLRIDFQVAYKTMKGNIHSWKISGVNQETGIINSTKSYLEAKPACCYIIDINKSSSNIPFELSFD